VTTVAELNRQHLENQYGQYVKELQALNQKLMYCNDPVEKLRSQNEYNHIVEEAEKIERQLAHDGMSASDPDRRYHAFQDVLPQIDFKKVEQIVSAILDEPNQRMFAALFLLQNYSQMGGEWCIARIRNILKDKTRANDFKPYQIECSCDKKWDETGLLNALANYWFTEQESEHDLKTIRDNSQQFASAIVRKIIGSVRGGSIVFIELRQWDNVYPHDRVLPWFLRSFWEPLVDLLPSLAEKYLQVKVFIVIVSYGDLSTACVPSIFRCAGDDEDCERLMRLPQKERIIELPLRNWTQEEIRDWLANHFRNLQTPQVNSLSEKIFRRSQNGNPALVRNELDYHLRGIQP
jgi:hypothetical protein